MKSHEYPQPPQVLDDIGEKCVEAFARSVQRSSRDLQTYRENFPQWVADHSERGLANWISDRLWTHLVAQADGISGMDIYEKGVTREIVIGLNYKFRVKRHDEEGNIASYPTQTFLEFASQPAGGQLSGFKQWRLIAGYDWNREERQIGGAVISLRDGKDNVIWKEPLPVVADEQGGSVTAPVVPQKPAPAAPKIDVPDNIGQKSKESGDKE